MRSVAQLGALSTAIFLSSLAVPAEAQTIGQRQQELICGAVPGAKCPEQQAVIRNASPTRGATPSAPPMPTAPLAKTYTYDANGNLISNSEGDHYTYDSENRLTRVLRADGTVVEHVYDFDGNRMETRVNAPGGGAPTITKYLVDPEGPGGLSQIVAETDSSGNLQAHYVRGNNLLAVMRPLVPTPSSPPDWQSRFVHLDSIGSVRRLTNETGVVTDGYAYSAFGELLGHSGTDVQRYAFTGEPYDANVGLQYHRARWMDPKVGRFVGMDPFLGSISDPVTLHRYLYAGIDPVDRSDPTGLDFSLGVSLTSLGLSNTIAGIHVPHARAMLLSAAHLELVPVQIRDRAWTGGPTRPGYAFAGWDTAEMLGVLGDSQNFWNHHGVLTVVAPIRGPVLVGNSTIYSPDQLTDIAQSADLRNYRLNQLPVVFARSLGGTSAHGSAPKDPSKPGLVLLEQAASWRTLTHEVGHNLGLGHSWNPFGLMFPYALGGIYLFESERAEATKGLHIRNGSR
jgi:RHS repeat-associated protein